MQSVISVVNSRSRQFNMFYAKQRNGASLNVIVEALMRKQMFANTSGINNNTRKRQPYNQHIDTMMCSERLSRVQEATFGN